MNLGTFKAFGLNHKELQNIYLVIMLSIVVTAMAIALLLALLLGYGYLFSSILQLSTELALEAGQSYFLPWYILYSCVLIIVVTYFTMYRTIQRSLHRTPGDLIYGRYK
jgi:ABC-type antimicrobial peptide transport system permease subunit